MATRQSIETWTTIFKNINYTPHDEVEEVEIVYLDGGNEWALVYGEELFEDGFKSEVEALSRLDEVMEAVCEQENARWIEDVKWD